MAEKGIVVTKDNQDDLTTRFNPQDLHVKITPGYIFVRDFGEDDGNYVLLTQPIFEANYQWYGDPLRNGFREVRRR